MEAGRWRLAQAHSRVRLIAHVVWATAHREPILAQRADAWVARVLAKKAGEHGCDLLASGCAADHVHALLRYPSTVPVASVLQALKGYSSYAWNRAAPRPLKWQAGYWAESVSPDAVEEVAAYVANQRQHHAAAAAAENWELDGSSESSDFGTP
jgi:putative transposase